MADRYIERTVTIICEETEKEGRRAEGEILKREEKRRVSQQSGGLFLFAPLFLIIYTVFDEDIVLIS